MKKVLFYITGHGFGHATRMIHVINHLATHDDRVRPVVNTSVPKWLFDQQMSVDYQYVPCQNDVAVVQDHWAKVDKLQTLDRYREFIENEAVFTRTQLEFIRQNRIVLIVADIPAIAFSVARAAGLPAVGISNFSWDWICRPYVEEHPGYRWVIERLRRWYGSAALLLRLPFHGDLSAFPVIEDIPLIAGRSVRDKREVVERLGLDGEKVIVLLYLGAMDYSTVLPEAIQETDRYVFLRPDRVDLGQLQFVDLVKAADVVLTKPGYGIVSECIANRTVILYTSRADFREYVPLVAGIERYAVGRFVPPQDLPGGRWIAHLDGAVASDCVWPDVELNGAELAAERISAII